jgi:hypothetical protein
MGAVAKSYMRKGFLIYEEMRKYLVMYIRRPLVISDFATAPFWTSLYEENFVFFCEVDQEIKWQELFCFKIKINENVCVARYAFVRKEKGLHIKRCNN